MKSVIISCVTAMGICHISASDIEIFEAEKKVMRVSTEAIQGKFDSNEESTVLYFYIPVKEVGSLRLKTDNLKAVFDEAVRKTTGEEPFFQEGRVFLAKDRELAEFYYIFVEDNGKRFRISPMDYVADKWFIQTRWGYQSDHVGILSILNKIKPKVKSDNP